MARLWWQCWKPYVVSYCVPSSTLHCRCCTLKGQILIDIVEGGVFLQSASMAQHCSTFVVKPLMWLKECTKNVESLWSFATMDQNTAQLRETTNVYRECQHESGCPIFHCAVWRDVGMWGTWIVDTGKYYHSHHEGDCSIWSKHRFLPLLSVPNKGRTLPRVFLFCVCTWKSRLFILNNSPKT